MPDWVFHPLRVRDPVGEFFFSTPADLHWLRCRCATRPATSAPALSSRLGDQAHVRRLPRPLSNGFRPPPARQTDWAPGLQVQVRHRIQQVLDPPASHQHQGCAQDLRMHSLRRLLFPEGQSQGSLPSLPQGHGCAVGGVVQLKGIKTPRCWRFSSPSGSRVVGRSLVCVGSGSCVCPSSSSCPRAC